MKETEAQKKKRWAADAKRAKTQFESLRASGKMHLPANSPARRDTDLSTGKAKTEALAKKVSPKKQTDTLATEHEKAFGKSMPDHIRKALHKKLK